MSYEQNEINNFRNEFDKFVQYWYKWNSSQNNNFKYFEQFNTKLRMPFAIKNIELEYSFLFEKQADMKESHKFLYKLIYGLPMKLFLNYMKRSLILEQNN